MLLCGKKPSTINHQTNLRHRTIQPTSITTTSGSKMCLATTAAFDLSREFADDFTSIEVFDCSQFLVDDEFLATQCRVNFMLLVFYEIVCSLQRMSYPSSLVFVHFFQSPKKRTKKRSPR